ncbi:MAG: hypothetical protein N4A46_13025 [Schleiferiaceae bacterium]|jgi:hypothetical protein|nr:hypothetical protein [Schleiferiaceae bacterium]
MNAADKNLKKFLEERTSTEEVQGGKSRPGKRTALKRFINNLWDKQTENEDQEASDSVKTETPKE